MVWWLPGFSSAWSRGSRDAWFWAVGWSILFCLACRLTVARSPLDRRMLIWIWSGVATSWLIGVVWERWQNHVRNRAPTTESKNQFLLARYEYLRGHWFESRKLLEGLLETQADHIHARLLLATLHRRVGEFELAEAELRLLEVHEAADPWRLEIERERQWIDRDRGEKDSSNEGEEQVA